MGRSPRRDENGLKKGPWTPEEDQKLVDYVEAHGHGCWRNLPKLAGLNRCGKSCRLRWNNYLRPDIIRGKFSDEDERLIYDLHSKIGNKWSTIATHLPGRTDNEIKNFWNTHMKKKLLQMGIDPNTHQPITDLDLLLVSSFNNLNNPANHNTLRLAEAQLIQKIIHALVNYQNLLPGNQGLKFDDHLSGCSSLVQDPAPATSDSRNSDFLPLIDSLKHVKPYCNKISKSKDQFDEFFNAFISPVQDPITENFELPNSELLSPLIADNHGYEVEESNPISIDDYNIDCNSESQISDISITKIANSPASTSDFRRHQSVNFTSCEEFLLDDQGSYPFWETFETIE